MKEFEKHSMFFLVMVIKQRLLEKNILLNLIFALHLKLKIYYYIFLMNIFFLQDIKNSTNN